MCEARAKRYFVQQAIAGMPERDRLVLVLRDVLGFTSEEVAEAMTLSVSAVKARLVRARAALRKRLSHDMRFGRYATAGRFRFDRDGHWGGYHNFRGLEDAQNQREYQG